jgi:phosphoribosylformylglycinamidine (FGAM) synthase-like amidotransferase family enzyme
LQKNRGLKFVCAPTELRVESTDSVLTRSAEKGAILRIPINHFEGNYTCDAVTLARLRDEDRVVLRYVDNPNGSIDDIAGVCNEGRNVVGLMPHPERATDELLGSTDGLPLLRSLVA